MDTIQSMPSDSRNDENESTQGLNAQHKIYKTIYDVQGALMRLYTGDYKMFTDMTCPNCSRLAIEPKDCPNCGEQICKPCFSGVGSFKDQRECGGCKHVFGNDFKNAGKAVQGLLRNATFSCIYECGKMYLPLHKIEDHLDVCRERFYECPKADCKHIIKSAG